MFARGRFRTVVFLLSLAAGLSSLAAEQVTIPNVAEGGSLPLPGVLHKPDGAGPFPALVMLAGFGG